MNGFSVQLQCLTDPSPSFLNWPGLAQWQSQEFGHQNCQAVVKANVYAFSPSCVDASKLVQMFPLSAQAIVSDDSISLRVYTTSATCGGPFKDTTIIQGLNLCQNFNASSLIPVPHLPYINMGEMETESEMKTDIGNALLAVNNLRSAMRSLQQSSGGSNAYGAPQVSSIPAVAYQETGTVPSSSPSSPSSELQLWQKAMIGVGAVIVAGGILFISVAYAKGLYCFNAKKAGTINSPLIDGNAVNSDFAGNH